MGSSTCNLNLIDPTCIIDGSTKYHKAARDGNVVVLLEGTKRDFNRRDEDGLTPVHWAAYDGKLEALRVVIGRGGSVDLHDLYGNTPLHYAARNNHMHCVSYLINFGCNIWAVDNDGHTALDVANLLDHKTIVKYLDADMARRYATDQKKAEKMKRKSLEEAKKRLKILANFINGSTCSSSVSSALSSIGSDGASTVARSNRNHGNRNGDLRGNVALTMSKKFCDVFKRLQLAASGGDHSDSSVGHNEIHKKSINTLKKQKRCSSSDVLFKSPAGRKESIGSLFETNSKLYDRRMGLFERPGLGTVSFRHLDLVSMFPSEDEQISSYNTNFSSETYLSTNSSDKLVTESEIYENVESDLNVFLNDNGLSEYLPVFQRERITLESLVLLEEKDFTELNIPMGPRKLLSKAINSLKITQ